jgi:hypothetical protein
MAYYYGPLKIMVDSLRINLKSSLELYIWEKGKIEVLNPKRKLNNMKIKELKKNLHILSEEELIRLIVELYKKNEENKELIGSKFDPNMVMEAFEKYKKQIVEEFYPPNDVPRYPKYSNLRRSLKNFKDVSSDQELIADLMLTHVEKGVEYTNEYGDIDEKFYNNIESTYLRLLKHLKKHDLLAEYKDVCLEIVTATENIGWGFHDELTDIYHEFYG